MYNDHLMKMSQSATEAARQSHVMGELTSLEAAITRVDAHVSNLVGRLNDVLSPTPPAASGNTIRAVSPSSGVPLADRINSLKERLVVVEAVVESALNRLEL